MKFRTLALLTALLPLLGPALSAREMTVRALAFEPDFPKELHAHDPSGSNTAGLVEVKSFLNHENNKLKLKGDSVVFTRSVRPSSATSSDEVVSKVDLPDSTSGIILFTPMADPQHKGQCHAHAIDDSAGAFPAGSFKVVNLTEAPVKIELGEDSHEIAAGESVVISKITYSSSGSATMTASSKENDTWKSVSSGSWTDPGSKRVLEVFTQDPKSGRIEIKGIRDVAAP